jgi:hypothetical protein
MNKKLKEIAEKFDLEADDYVPDAMTYLKISLLKRIYYHIEENMRYSNYHKSRYSSKLEEAENNASKYKQKKRREDIIRSFHEQYNRETEKYIKVLNSLNETFDMVLFDEWAVHHEGLGLYGILLDCGIIGSSNGGQLWLESDPLSSDRPLVKQLWREIKLRFILKGEE